MKDLGDDLGQHLIDQLSAGLRGSQSLTEPWRGHATHELHSSREKEEQKQEHE